MVLIVLRQLGVLLPIAYGILPFPMGLLLQSAFEPLGFNVPESCTVVVHANRRSAPLLHVVGCLLAAAIEGGANTVGGMAKCASMNRGGKADWRLGKAHFKGEWWGQDDVMRAGLSLLRCGGVWKGPELGGYAKLEPVWQKWDRSVRQPFLL